MALIKVIFKGLKRAGLKRIGVVSLAGVVIGIVIAALGMRLGIGLIIVAAVIWFWWQYPGRWE